MKKVAVRDIANHDRLLGYLVLPETKLPNGPCNWREPIAPRIDWLAKDDVLSPVDFKIITFHFGWTATKDGWSKRRELFTDGSTEDLLLIENFFLPGETEDGHRIRRNTYNW